MTVEVKLGETTCYVQIRGNTAMVTVHPVPADPDGPILLAKIGALLTCWNEARADPRYGDVAPPEERVYWIKDWQGGGTNFRSMLLSMLGKADEGNRQRLAQMFPGVALAYGEWAAHVGPFEGLDYAAEGLGG